MVPHWRLSAGKTACITGAIALEYLRQGCNVAVSHLGLPKDEALRKSLHEEAEAIRQKRFDSKDRKKMPLPVSSSTW